MFSAKYPDRGFTIVELLIVIVVIAILASITVVAFNGVRQKADETRLTSTISSYAKALKLYKAENGVYPSVTSECFGAEGDLPATSRFTNNKCGFSNWNDLRNDTLNTALAKYLSPVPRANFTDELQADDGNYARGIFYSGDPTFYYYEYYVKPNRNCPIGRIGWTEANIRLCYDQVY